MIRIDWKNIIFFLPIILLAIAWIYGLRGLGVLAVILAGIIVACVLELSK